MNIIEYLHNFGMELSGLNDDLDSRALVLRYAKQRLEEALKKVEEVLDGDDSTGTVT